MKEEHFVLKDDGKLYWIERMPEHKWIFYPRDAFASDSDFEEHQHHEIEYTRKHKIALQSAIANAVEVSNQEELCNTLLNKYEPEILVEAGKLYSLQCSVVRTVKWKQGKSYMPYEVPVAVVAFSKDLSREGEKELVSGIAMQKAIEFVRTYPTGNTFDYRMGFEAGHEFAISKESVKEVSREGEKAEIERLKQENERMKDKIKQYEKPKKQCPKCGSDNVVMFTPDLDLCRNCDNQFI